MDSLFTLRRVGTIAAAVSMLATLGCTRTGAAEYSAQYSDNLGPEASHDGITLHLVSYTETSGGLRADIVVKNDSNARLVLPASDWKPTWLSIGYDGAQHAANLSFTDPTDYDQQWPDQLPLRRTVTLEPYQSVTYSVGCALPQSSNHAERPVLVVQGLLGNDRTPVEVKLPIPNSPDQVSAAEADAHSSAP